MVLPIVAWVTSGLIAPGVHRTPARPSTTWQDPAAGRVGAPVPVDPAGGVNPGCWVVTSGGPWQPTNSRPAARTTARVDRLGIPLVPPLSVPVRRYHFTCCGVGAQYALHGGEQPARGSLVHTASAP